MRNTSAIILSLFLLCGASGTAWAQKAPAFVATDAHKREVTVPPPGKALVLTFASKSTGEQAGNLLRAVRVAHPEVETLSVLDFSSYPRILRGTISKKVATRQTESVAASEAAYRAAGKTPPADLAARIHLAPDFEGNWCKLYGATGLGNTVVAVVIDKGGAIRARFSKTPTTEQLLAAVAQVAGP